MRAYMNNSHGRRHEAIYGTGAYFDLDLEGRQAGMLRGSFLGPSVLWRRMQTTRNEPLW